NLSHSSFINGGNFGVIAYGANSIPELQITFSGTVTPATGTYAITTNTVSYGLCSFTLADTTGGSQAQASVAAHGYVTVTASGASPNSALTFSNISVTGSSGHHTLSGTLYY
ncbi:MAG TPA: hypothetical protein VKG26_13190, partial [Bacteroidia bacterium]|nr:hypothetical protein [Bacteroidia bacterium]